jgi:hypothetical protein
MKWLLVLMLSVNPQNQPVIIIGPNSQQVCTTVCCGTTPTALPPAPLYGRVGELVQNQGAESIYIGNASALDGGTGIILTTNATLAGSLGWANPLYCTADGGQLGDGGCCVVCEYQ